MIHVHLNVTDLDRSRRFYEQFLGSAPVKLRPGYAKFLPESAPLNLALSEGSSRHLGIQVDSTEEVRRHLARVKAAGLPVREEMGVDCCHANQDKFWVRDPDGNEWEIYHLNYDLAGPSTSQSTSAIRTCPDGVRCSPSEVAPDAPKTDAK